MEYYIGIHGVQSGPFSEVVIREKIASHAFPPDTLCWKDGWPEWRPLSQAFPSTTSTPPPPLPPMVQRWPGSPTPAASPVDPTQATTSGLAIASLILGVVGFVGFITAIPAVICGHIACSNIKSSNGAQKGRGLAIAGLVLGYFVISLFPVGLVAAMAIPAFSKVRESSREKAIINNLRQLDAAAQQFMLEKGVNRATYADLVGPGPDHYIRDLQSIAGERYTDLVIRESDKEIRVTTAAGRVIKLSRFYSDERVSFSAPATQ